MWFEVLGGCLGETLIRITYVILLMLYSLLQPTPSKDTYNRLIARLQAGENPKEVYEEIEEYCRQCNPSNPMTCLESCELWTLKKKNQDYAKNGVGNETDLLNTIKNTRRIRILKNLSAQPSSLKDLQQKLKEEGLYRSQNSLSHYLMSLVKLHLLEEEGKVYRLTEKGIKISEIIDKETFQELPSESKGYEEAVLKTLNNRACTYADLAAVIPRKVLSRVLRRLMLKSFIVKDSSCDRVFYFLAKRRPTRRLSPTELRIFHAIPKNDGISVRELSGRVGISIRRTYKYLRRLRIKRHVLKHKKDVTFTLSPKGISLVKSINTVLNIIAD